MKLFQNLSTDLAEESIKRLFLFIAMVAILFNVADCLSNFGRGSPKKHSCIIISKSILWFRRRSHLKVFSIFSSGSHLAISFLAILFKGTEWFEQFL